MEKNDIKKALYKQNPKAYLISNDENGYRYRTEMDNGTAMPYSVYFKIPKQEADENIFHNEMDAKYLIRWL